MYPWPLLLSVLPAAPGLVFLELGLIWLLHALGRRGDRCVRFCWKGSGSLGGWVLSLSPSVMTYGTTVLRHCFWLCLPRVDSVVHLLPARIFASALFSWCGLCFSRSPTAPACGAFGFLMCLSQLSRDFLLAVWSSCRYPVLVV